MHPPARYTAVPLPPAPADRGADLHRIEQALATIATVSDAWFQHARHETNDTGLLVPLDRLRALAFRGHTYAIALRVANEDPAWPAGHDER